MAAAASSVMLATAVSVPHYVFTQANYPGASLTNANGANLSQIVGYYTTPVGQTLGYIETGSSFITAQPAGSCSSYLFAINGNGVGAGGFYPHGAPACGAPFAAHGYTYEYATGAITTIDYPGAGSTAAYGINDSGVIVGGFCVQGVAGCPIDLTLGSSHAFMDDNGVFTQLDFPGAELTTAFGINNAGAIVGIYTTTAVEHSFIYQNGVYADLNYPGANWTIAQGINNAGVVVGYYQDTLDRVFGFMYYKGQWAQINARSGGSTAIIGISNHNDLVGTWSGPGLNPAIKGVPTKSIPILQNEAQ